MNRVAGNSATPGMTYDQARATHPKISAWVGASAGTGKTHVLTARVLRLMLTGTPPENIVCLTFTKAAAAEMKNRIFVELGRWTTLSDGELTGEIAARVDEQADEKMLARARQLFALVLDLSGGLQIQTFHSFCQALLGRFPLEADMSPGFEGIDEAEANELMQSAKDKMLAATRAPLALELQQALDVVAALVTERTFDEVVDRLSFEAPLLKRAVRACGGTAGLLAELYRRLGATVGETVHDIIANACASERVDQSALLGLASAMQSGSKNDQSRAAAIMQFIELSENQRPGHFSAYKAAFLTKAGTALKTVATKKILDANESLKAIIEAEQQQLLVVEEACVRQKAATATAALLRLGLEQLRRYNHVKGERGLVDFDDLIDRTVTLFSQAEVAPWILYKLDNRIDHILVDEAQDTNRDQWRVVETLAAEFFAGDGARDIERTIFAVGDAKQSIFSFQRADPREFIGARNRVFAQANSVGHRTEAIPLSLSFRSGEAVLSLVDSVFSEGGRAWEGLSADGEIVAHRFKRVGHAGRVELWPLEHVAKPEKADLAEECGEGGWQMPVDQAPVDDAEQRCAWRIASHIHRSVGTRPLPSRGRAVQAGDILVLVRRRTAFVDHLVKALKTLGVPVAGRDRMVLLDELPVMDLLAVAQFAVLPTDDLTLAVVLKSPLVGLSDDDLFRLAHGRSGSLWNALYAMREDTHFKDAYQLLVGILNRADIGGPFDFFNHILIDLDGRRKLAGRLGDEIHDPVDELQEEALAFELTHSASLLAFIERVRRNNTQIKRDMEQAGDRVRIMTTHSAKGLQAPIVYLSDLVGLPDLSRDGRLLPLEPDMPLGPTISVWASQARGLPEIEAAREQLKARQLSEYRRLLYVALTRAEDDLYVAGWRGANEPGEDCWYKLISDGFDGLDAAEHMSEGRAIRCIEVEQTAAVEAPIEMGDGHRVETVAPAWLFEAMPTEPTPVKPLAPSRPDEEPAVTGPLDRSTGQRFRRGNLLHALLQWLPDMPPAARQPAALAYLRRADDLSDGDAQAFWQEVEAVLDDPALGALFGPGSRAEVPIAGLVETASDPAGRPIAGQVDRLVASDDQVMIIDYKTNRPPPAQVSGVPDVYLRQMGLYVRALKSVYPGKKITAALLWTDAARLMELPDQLIEQSLVDAGL